MPRPRLPSPRSRLRDRRGGICDARPSRDPLRRIPQCLRPDAGLIRQQRRASGSAAAASPRHPEAALAGVHLASIGELAVEAGKQRGAARDCELRSDVDPHRVACRARTIDREPGDRQGDEGGGYLARRLELVDPREPRIGRPRHAVGQNHPGVDLRAEEPRQQGDRSARIARAEHEGRSGEGVAGFVASGSHAIRVIRLTSAPHSPSTPADPRTGRSILRRIHVPRHLMGRLLNIVTPLHQMTKRDYLARMVDDKVHCMLKAKEYEGDYWDGDRRYGYGGYRYLPGRWKPVAQALIDIYGLKPGAKVLDVGCGKGYLLREFQRLLPEADLVGFDISKHGLADAHPGVKDNLFRYRAQDRYPFGDKSFDLVVSLGTFHNLKIFELATTLSEVERVGKHGYIMVESYRNELEQFNMQCWALTCEAFFDTASWIWLYQHFGYTGDYEFIYFE